MPAGRTTDAREALRRPTVLLRRKGLRVNHKRIYRLCREEGLAVRPRKRKRLSRIAVGPLPAVTGVNQRQTMDFIEDRLVTGQQFRTFNVMDAFSGLEGGCRRCSSVTMA